MIGTVTRHAAICLFAAAPAWAIAQGQGDGKPTALDVKASGTKTFYLNSRVGNSQVTILSESTLEDFTAVCNRVAGECSVDPKAVESFRGKFSIRVEDIETGIELRDGHLRSADWLDGEKHPDIIVEVTAVEDARKVDADTASVTLVSKCSLHGKTREERMPATLTYLDESPRTMRRVKGDLLRIRAEFSIKLSDYGVTGPAGSDTIGLKVADEIDLRVAVFASTERPPDALEADSGQESPRRAPPPRDKP